jgi:uncharacterized protein (DUF1697 family)
MYRFIALLRGINVGGSHKLPMRELVTVLEGLGLHQVQTYIQSGNVVFQSESSDSLALSQQISQAIGQSHGFAPSVLILTQQELQEAIAVNPFPEGEANPKTLHLFFLDAHPQNPDLKALEMLKANGERFQLINKVFYLYAPEGIGRSKLAEKVGKGWGVVITARNWRTVTMIRHMVEEQ